MLRSAVTVLKNSSPDCSDGGSERINCDRDILRGQEQRVQYIDTLYTTDRALHLI